MADSMVKLTISGGANAIYVNNQDMRGQWLIRSHGITQREVTDIWRKAVEALRPTIVLDVGVNYGEILLSAVYEPQAQVIGIEANRELQPFIYRSVKKHSNKDQIRMFYAVAAATDAEEIPFYIDRGWSGKSSAVPDPSGNKLEQKAGSITIDSLLDGSSLRGQRCLFKIDVEGYEGHVLHGMDRLLRKSEFSMGLIEFNNRLLLQAGTTMKAFFGCLARRFLMYYPTGDELVQLDPVHYDTVCSYFGKKDIHANLLIATNEDIVSCLGLRKRAWKMTE